jgi:hypothetical protein
LLERDSHAIPLGYYDWQHECRKGQCGRLPEARWRRNGDAFDIEYIRTSRRHRNIPTIWNRHASLIAKNHSQAVLERPCRNPNNCSAVAGNPLILDFGNESIEHIVISDHMCCL